ncbi:MAG: hypothetical protein ABIG63_17555 [Chloroflexota bacterium]
MAERPPGPAIESHPNKQKIIDAMLEGKPSRYIREHFAPDLHYTTIARYKRTTLAQHIRTARKLLQNNHTVVNSTHPAQQLAIATQQVSSAQPFVSRLKAREDRREGWMKKAEDKEDFRALAALDRNEHGDIRLEAELTGALAGQQQQPGAPAVVIVMPSLPGPQPADVVDVEVVGGPGGDNP